MVDARIYTKSELQQIQNGAAAYDRLSDAQMAAAKEYAERPLQKRDIAGEIYQAIEDDNLDTLRYLAEDIGVLNRLRETFRDNKEIQEWAKHLIMLDYEKMKEISEEIENDRNKVRAIKNI